jgi:hypothetical protein
VRSFGTEDRPTDRPVPARDEIFEYIIFRGADIEDLQVREPPQSSLTQDPAIVEVHISIIYTLRYNIILSFISHLYIRTILVRIQLEPILILEVLKNKQNKLIFKVKF